MDSPRTQTGVFFFFLTERDIISVLQHCYVDPHSRGYITSRFKTYLLNYMAHDSRNMALCSVKISSKQPIKNVGGSQFVYFRAKIRSGDVSSHHVL